MMLSRSRWLLIALVALTAVALALLLRPLAVDVDLARVERGPLSVTVDEEGRTRVRDRFVVSAPVTGHLERIDLQAGDAITTGQRVARIAPLPLDTRTRRSAAERLAAAEATHRAAEARVAEAAAARDQANRALERLRRVDVETPGSIARQRLDEAESATVRAEAAVTQARQAAEAAAHEVGSARAALLDAGPPSQDVAAGCDACAEVQAPGEGRVLRVLEPSARVVGAGTPLLEIGDPADLEVVVDVRSDDVVRLGVGSPARISVGASPDSLDGRVSRIEPSAFTRVSPLGVEEQRVHVIVGLTAPSTSLALGDRYRVDVSLVTWQSDDVVRVPVSALFRLDGGWAVWLADGGHARLRPIELGPRGRDAAVVTRGLEPGDAVVTYPPESLEDGARIRARTATAAAAPDGPSAPR